MLRAAQADADKNLPDDDLRVIDDTAFYGAISTIDKNRKAPVEVVIRTYLASLTLREAQLERPRPTLEVVRSLPLATPKPLSDGSIPADLRSLRFAFGNYARQSAIANASTLSYCEITPALFDPNPTPSLTCSEGVQNNNYTFSAQFTQYNATTKKTTDPVWNSPANQGPFQTVGVCWAFVDCNGGDDVLYFQGTTNGVGPTDKTILKTYKVSQGQSAQQFHWTLDRYPQPTINQCDICDPFQGGQVPVSVNAAVPTTTWAFDYSCTVTP
jgi:hypothetical protein